MAIIYTYPTVTPSLTDKVLISGVNNKTQNATLNSIKDVLDVVDTFSSTFGTFISGTNNTSATGNVSVGTIDLSATGTPSSTKFLKGNNTWDSVSLTTDVSGILPIANGGTNASTASAAITNLLPSQAGQAGNFLKTDGTTATWASAAGGGTITGSGTANQVAYFSGNSAIAGQDSLTLTNSGVLRSGSFSDDIAGSIHIENETGNVGGTLRLYGKENDTGASKYIVLNASQSASASAYNLYFPPTVASAAGKVLKSAGANGELEWGEDTGITGSLLLNQFPVATGQASVANSIMSQQVATSNPTHYRIRITSPSTNPNLGQFPSLQLYNGSNGSWSTGAVLSEIQTYSADASTPSNPHVCSFINTVRGEPLSGAAVDGELVFGTAPYNEPVGAQESMRIDRDGSILVKQVGISTDDNYRTGVVKLQGKGAIQFYESGSFDDDNFKISSSFPATANPEFQIGDTSAFNGYIGLYSNGTVRARIYSTGLELVPPGSANDPSLSFARTTPGTKAGLFYTEASNKISLASQGTELFTVTGTSGSEVITSKKEHQFDENINITGYVSSDLDVGDTGDGYDINVADGNVRLKSGTFYNDIPLVTSTNNVATFNGNNGNIQRINLTENVTINWSGLKNGAIYTIIVYRGSGQQTRTITWNASTKFPGDTEPGQTNAQDIIDIYQFVHASVTYGMGAYLNIPSGAS